MICLASKTKGLWLRAGPGYYAELWRNIWRRRARKVCIADYDEFRANEVAKKIQAAGGYALPLRINVLDKAEIQNAFSCALNSMGRIDVLINGAGGNKKEATTSDQLPFFDLPGEALRAVFDLNFLGTFLPSQVFGNTSPNRRKAIFSTYPA